MKVEVKLKKLVHNKDAKSSFWKYLLEAFVSESTLHVILRRKPFSEKIGLKVKFNIGIS